MLSAHALRSCFAFFTFALLIAPISRAQEGPPVVNGTIVPFEWLSTWQLFDTGPRPPSAVGWERLGVNSWIGHDQNFLYVGLNSYPASLSVDGPFANLYIELHGTTPPRFIGQFHDNLSGTWPGIGTPWPSGTVMLRGGVVAPSARGSFEAKIPYASLGLDPYTENYEVHLRINAPGGGGYDTLLSVGGGYVAPPTPAGSGRSLVVASPSRFVGRTKPRLFPSASILGTAGRGVSAVIATNLNGDARREIVAAFSGSNELDVLENSGGADFLLLNRISGLGHVIDLSSGDLNADGFPDVIAIQENTAVHIMFGDGLGALTPPLTIPFLGAARAIPFAFDADSDLDLALVTRQGPLFDGALWILRNDGAGTWTPISWAGDLGMPEAIAAGDVDGDAREDLIVADMGSVFRPHGLWLFRNLPLPARSFLPGVAFPSAVAIGDFDGDSFEDAIAISASAFQGTQDLFFAPGLIGGGLGPFAGLGLAAELPWDFALGDLGGDKVPDLYLMQQSDRSLRSLTNFQGASFSGQRNFAATPATAAFAVGDFQGDGFEDVVFWNVASDDLMVRYAAEAPRVDLFGSACPGTPGTPLIGATGSPVLGGVFTFELSNAPANSLCELFIGFSAFDIPIGGGCSIYFDLNFFIAVLLVTSPSGTASIGGPIPYEPLLVGADSFAQWVVADPGGAFVNIASFSAGLRARLGLADG